MIIKYNIYLNEIIDQLCVYIYTHYLMDLAEKKRTFFFGIYEPKRKCVVAFET